MREMGIKAQYVRPYTVTTIDSDFSIELTNILNEEFNPKEPNAMNRFINVTLEAFEQKRIDF